jgi:hypothetical protein
MARTAARLAVWAVLSGACAGGGDPPGEGDAAPVAAPFRSALIGDPVPPSEPFRLTLLSPGKEPRRDLRYRVATGTHERTRFAISNEVEVFVAGRRINRVAPPTTEVAFEVEVASRPGGYRCTAWITDTASSDWERMAPGRGSELRDSLELLRGHHIKFEVDDRGHPVSDAITLPESVESNRAEALQILQGVDGLVVPFPTEPIGAGAVWTVADLEAGRSSLAGGVLLTYSLVAVRGDHLELSMSLSLPHEPAPLSFGGKEIAGYGGAVTSGELRIGVDLGHLLSDTAGDLSVEIEGRTFSGIEELPFKVHQTIRQHMESR